MFNPVFPFTMSVLQKTVERGCLYFVRNNWPHGFDHFEADTKASLLISHYNDKAKAEAHYQAISKDPYRFIYDWNNEEHKIKLKIAASNPAGYKVFSTYFYDDFKKRITNNTKDNINKWMRQHTSWKSGKGETVAIDMYLQFGSLFINMSYAGQHISVKFEDIEKKR